MKDWWLRLLGVDGGRIPDDAEIDFMLTDAPQSWRVFLAFTIVALLIYAVFYFYRREIDACPRRAKIALAALRAAVLLLLLFVLMGPALGISKHRSVRPNIVLLLDESMSMSIRDHDRQSGTFDRGQDAADPARPSRAEVVDQMLRRHDGDFLRQLGQRGDLRVLTFSNKLRQSEPAHAPGEPLIAHGADDSGDRSNGQVVSLPSLSPSGPGTDLSGAVRGALERPSGKPVAGIVLISDGQNNQGDDPLDAADEAAERRVPIFAVGIGNPNQPHNLKVANVYFPESVFRSDPLTIEAEIRAYGLDDATVEVQLLERKAEQMSTDAASESVVARQSLPIRAGLPATVEFEHMPQTDGKFVYTVRVEALPGELIESDNAEFAVVNVLSNKAKVLFVAGAPTWEYRMVRGLLLRDKTIDVSCWLQSRDAELPQEGNVVIDHLPQTPEQLFKYDVVLMFDPDPSPQRNPTAFSGQFIDLTKRFVDEHAGGLLYMAGPKYAISFLGHTQTQGLRDILPVQYREHGVSEVEALTRRYSRPWPIRVAADGLDHPLLRLTTDQRTNRRLWEQMPGVYWSFPIDRPKPTTRVLLEHTDPTLATAHSARPLLVTGRYGSGRTVYLGFDGTWRWRRLGRDSEVFDRFWIQLVRYLIEGRLLGTQRRGRIVLDRETYPVGSRIVVGAELSDVTYRPLTLPDVPAVFRHGTDEVDVRLTAVPNKPGHYQASLIATQLGLNELSIMLPGASQRITRQFTVEIPRVEFDDPRLNRKLLADMADRSGGRYFTIDQIDQIPAAIPDRQQSIVIQGKPAQIWDTNRLLLLLVVLLSIEWSFRKFYRLM